MRKSFPSTLAVIIALLFLACNKTILEKPLNENVTNNNVSAMSLINSYIDSFSTANNNGDTVETMTVLGKQLTNPYLVSNITQAYHNLGIYNVTINVTDKYVRFKPTFSQFKYLDSLMDVRGLELFDFPLDYQVLKVGDYYQDPSIPAEQPTWQYAVVPANFSFPSGIQYETLAQIHIPGDDYTAVETEAERLAALQGDIEPMDAHLCPEGFHWDAATHLCVEDDCPPGYYWNGTTCVVYTPPPPAPDAAKPAGTITVDETQPLAGLATSTTQPNYRKAPVRKALIVARRWFKIERTYTNNNGQFQFSKRFKHKVRINVKFKNDDAVVRCLRGARVWNTFSPLNEVIGVYSGNKSNINYNFAQYGDRRAIGNQYWVGGTVHNGLQEYKDFAPVQGIGLPPGKLSILITNWSGSGAAPMLEKLASDNFPPQAITYYIANTPGAIAGGVPVLQTVIGRNIDVIIGFSKPQGYNFFNFKSDDLKETTYHELTHAAHYQKLGTAWYTQFLNSTVTAIINNIGSNGSPYGYGGASYSPIIALGESWAYYMGHFMADLRYGAANSTTQSEQPGISFGNSGGVSAHIRVLENFDPNYTTDPFDWIPQGLYLDLRDTENETNPITDLVSGYTNQQMFNAFNSSITTLPSYRNNLLSQNGNNQSVQVTALFNQYHY